MSPPEKIGVDWWVCCRPLSQPAIPSGAIGKEINFLLPPGTIRSHQTAGVEYSKLFSCGVGCYGEHLQWTERCRLVQTPDSGRRWESSHRAMDGRESQEVETCEATPLTFSPALLPCCSLFAAAGRPSSTQTRRYRHLRTQTGERRHPGAGRSG